MGETKIYVISMDMFDTYWPKFASGLTSAKTAEQGAGLKARYREPHRGYHNTFHLADLFSLYDDCISFLKNPQAVLAAIFYHDAIYDPAAKDNEEQSAALARKDLAAMAFPPAFIDRVAELILYTKSHDCPPGDNDAALFLDMDMAILGANPARYAQYIKGVRQEYAIYDDKAFYAGRLNLFLLPTAQKPRLFHTPLFEKRFGAKARTNMRGEIAAIRKTLAGPGPAP